MRELRYFLELSDATHRDQAPISFTVAESLLKGMAWNLPDGNSLGEDGEPVAPFMLFLDEGESFFMIMPESSTNGPQPDGYRVTARVLDKWNLLGLLSKDRTFTLNYGLIGLDDALSLVKLFFEDNYPALRSLEKGMSQNSRP